jgi:glycosyltransferase 2 family protein
MVKVPGNEVAHRTQWRVGRIIGGGIVTLVSLGYIAYVIYAGRDLLLANITQIKPMMLIVAFGTYSVDLVLAVWGWTRIMGRLSGLWDYRRHFKVYCYTNATRRLPGLPWHLLGRAVLYEGDGIGKSMSAVGSVLEVVVILIAGALTYLSIQLIRFHQVSGLAWLGLIILIGFTLTATFPWVIKTLGHRLDWERPPEVSIIDTVQWVAVYGAVWAVGGLVLFSTINALYPIPLNNLPDIMSVWILSGIAGTLVTFIPSGLGITEATLTFLLQDFVPPPLAAVIAILMRIVLTGFEILWAGIALKF